MFHKYAGNYPKDRHTGWSDNLQGVTHDESHWFFTQTGTLWKFPVGHDLNQRVTKADLSRGILKVGIPNVLNGYDHFGDLDCRDGYLFIPMTGRRPPIIAVFCTADLRFVDSAPLGDQSGAGWCAFNPIDGLLYTSNSTLSTKSNDEKGFRYAVDFERLAHGQLHLQAYGYFELKTERGGPLELRHMQGGVFSDSGVLYTVNGYIDTSTENTGIMAFKRAGGTVAHSIFKRVAKSSNGNGNFNYEFHPYDGEEPEGVTLWNLDDGRAPGIEGQLHVIMIDNDWWNDDDLYFKHYKVLDHQPTRVGEGTGREVPITSPDREPL